VGVVSTVRMLGPFNNPNVDDSGFYVPFYSTAVGPATPGAFVNQFATVIVKPRAGQRPESIVAALRRDIQKADPNLPLYFVGTPSSQLDVFVSQNRIIATLFSIFGGVAVVLAAVGIYGVMSFAVSGRTQEFGVRMALGANTPRILQMVVRQGAVQLAIGLAVGLSLAFGLAVLAADGIRNLLFGVTGRDPVIYASVAGLVSLVALVATLVPARRATRVDPMVVLRMD
jgi:ABC-type antimicrobial peptide transport system permease subunit